MKTNILGVMVCCIILCAQCFAQDGDIICPVTNPMMTPQGKVQGGTVKKGTASLSKTRAATSVTTGSPDLVIVFVDYPEGRI